MKDAGDFKRQAQVDNQGNCKDATRAEPRPQLGFVALVDFVDGFHLDGHAVVHGEVNDRDSGLPPVLITNEGAYLCADLKAIVT